MNCNDHWFLSRCSKEMEDIPKPFSHFEDASNPQKFDIEVTANADNDVTESNGLDQTREKCMQEDKSENRPSLTKILYMQQQARSIYKNIGDFIITSHEVFERSLNSFQLKKQRDYISENTFQIGAEPSTSVTNICFFNTNLSPLHSTIIYKDHLRPYFTFMLCLNKVQSQKCEKCSLMSKLPREIHSLIVSFLGETKSYYVRDEGSNSGTYQIVRSNKPTFLRTGQIFKITRDISINILEMNNKGVCFRQRDYPVMKKLMKHGFVELLGLDSSQVKKLKKTRCSHTRDLKWGESRLEFGIPFVAAEIGDEKKNFTRRYLFFPSTQDSFLIGRNYEADILIDDLSCSRNHCKIFYDFKAAAWKIVDGWNNVPSLFGTWESLQTIQQKKEKAKSEEVLISDGSKFMFNDCVCDFTVKKIKINSTQSITKHKPL